MITALAPIAALLTGAFILVAGSGLVTTLLPLRASAENFLPFEIGIIGGAYFVGFVLGCIYGPRVVRRAGHIRSFSVFAAVAGAAILIHALVLSSVVWIVLRLIGGACFAGLYMVIESWLNERATNETRGRVFAGYQVVNFVAAMSGQFMLNLAAPAGFQLFSIAAILVSVALVPVAVSASRAPEPIGRVRIRLGWLYRVSPVGFVGCFSIGLANGAFWSLGPVFASRSGMDVAGIANFMAALILGGALLQWPLGRLSDRVDRRWVICGSAGAAAVLGVVLAVLGPLRPELLIPLAALYGAAALGIYAICVSHANDYVTSADFVETSSGLLLLFGSGASVGPMIAAALMQLPVPGAEALFLFTAAVHAALGLFVVYRRAQRPVVPAETHGAFVATPAQMSPVSAAMDPRSPETVEAPPDQPVP